MLYSAATIQNNTAADQLPAVDHVWSAAQESREKEANNYSKGEVFPLSPTGRQFCVGASQGMVITYKKIRFNSHLTRDNTQYASGFIGSVSRLLPSCLLLKLANHKKLYCLIKHAVEHYQKKLLTRKKAKAIKAIATKQIIWLNSISLLSFQVFLWPLSITLRQKLFCSYKQSQRDGWSWLVVEMRNMFLHCHSDADLLCVITVKPVCRKMFEIVLSKLVEKHYPPQKCEKH